MDDKLQKAYDALSTKYEMPDFDTFKSDVLSNPEKRLKAFEGLQDLFELPTYEKFESDLLGNVPAGVVKSDKPFFDLLSQNLSAGIENAKKTIEDIGSGVGTLLGGTYSLFADAPDYVKEFLAKGERAAYTNPGYLTPQSPMPSLIPDPEPRQLSELERKEKLNKAEKELHRIYTSYANTQRSSEEFFQKNLGIKPMEEGFWKGQIYSIGSNLPFLLIGGGAAKTGLKGLSAITKTIMYPLFTQMEATQFSGEVYSHSAQKDKNGKVIEGTGNLDDAGVASIFGTLAGTLEFVGVSQAVDLIGKLGKNELKGLGAKTLFKELGLVSLSEGGEEVSQDAIEQLTKMGLNLQDSFSFKQSLDSFIAGGVGGLLLGGVSVSMNTNKLYELKKFAETVPAKVDKMVKDGIVTKEKAEVYKETAKVLLNTPTDKLQTAFEAFQEAKADVTRDLTQTILGVGKGLDVYDKITTSDIKDPYGRYDYAINDQKTKEQFVKRLEGSEEFQNLQRETAIDMPNAKTEDILKATHNRLHKEVIPNAVQEEGREEVLIEGRVVSPLSQAKERMKALSLRAGEALNLIESVFNVGSDMLNQGDDVFKEKAIDTPKSKFKENIDRESKVEPILNDEKGMVNAVVVSDEGRVEEQQNILFEKDPRAISLADLPNMTTPQVTKFVKEKISKIEFNKLVEEASNKPENKIPVEGKTEIDMQSGAIEAAIYAKATEIVTEQETTMLFNKSPQTPLESAGKQNVPKANIPDKLPNRMPLTKAISELKKRKDIPESNREFFDWLFKNADSNLEVAFENPEYVIGRAKDGRDVKLGKETLGAWTRDFATQKPLVVINRSKIKGDLEGLWRTLGHEVTHDYIFDALTPFKMVNGKQIKNPKFDLAFYNRVSALYKEVQFRMDTDQNLFYRDPANRADLERIFGKEIKDADQQLHEFVAYMLARNSKLADWASKTEVSNKTKQTYLGKFIDLLKWFFSNKGLKSPTFMDAMETTMSQFFGAPAQIDFWNEIYNDTSDIYENMREVYDQFEKIQDPDSQLDNPKLIRTLGKILADNIGDKPTDYIAYIKSLTFDQFRGRTLSVPEWNKSVELYFDTQKFEFSVPELKEKLITQLYEYAASLELHPTIRLVTRYDAENDALSTTIEELGDYYRDKENSIKSGWRNKINLSERISQLTELTGIGFELVYLDDVKHIQGDRTMWKHINSIDFGTKYRNNKYAKLFTKHNILFPGTWSDKGTVVALRPLGGRTVQDVHSALNEIAGIYDAKVADLVAKGIPFTEVEKEDPAIERNMTMRLLIEDLRLGGQIVEGKLQSSLFNPDDPSSYDLVKILKRPTEVAPRVATVQTKDRIAKALKSNPIGIVEGPSGLESRSVIFNAKPERGEWIASVMIKGREIKFDMADVLINKLGTEGTDGNVYFLDEGFGQTYRYLHGIINPGGVKVWVGNSLSGNFSTPIFVKGFWQKVSTKDLFGLWMKQNNVTVAISSTAVKVNGGYQISNLSKPDQTQIFNIPFTNINRDKEKGIVKKSVRGLIQSLTANLDTKDNPFFEGDYSEYYTQLLENLSNEFVDAMSDMTPETVLEELKEVAMNSTSQYEQSLARIILDIAYSQADEEFRQANSIFFVDSKEANIKRRISNTRLAKDLGGLFHEPFFAEIIKSKISKAIHRVINHRGSASWMMLRPDVGYAEPSHIESLFDILTTKEQRKRSDRLNELMDERRVLLGSNNDELLASVDAEIKQIKESLEYQTAELQEKVWKQMDEYIDPVSGRLLEGNFYISEDAVETHSIQNLDDVVITMVPSDGMTAQQAGKAIPVSLDYVDPGTISANSEQTQTVGGKDFDGDSTHLNAYNPKYGTRKAWDKYVKTIQDTAKKHKELTLRYYRNVLKDNQLQEADIHKKDIQLKFMQILSNSNQSSDKKYWNHKDLFRLLDLFQKDVANVISSRKYMTVKSQLGFSSEIVYNKRTRKFKTTHKRIPLYYLAAMRLTHDAVDKPSNENGLHYEFDDLRLAELMYGENYGYLVDGETVYDDKDRPGLQAVNAADKFLFGYGLQFTTGRNLQDRDMDRGLSEDLNYIATQQSILQMLEKSTTGKRALAESFAEWYIPRHTNQTPEQAQYIIKLGQQYIQNAQMTKPDGSAVMNAVKNIPLYRIPNIGTSRNVYLAWQYRISREMNKGREELITRVSEQWKSAIGEFRSRMNQQYVTNFLMTSENPKLHLAKAILINFILPVDQRLFKQGEHEGRYHTDIFNRANEAVYPRLIRLLLEGKTFIFNKANEAVLTTDRSSVTLSKVPYNGIKVSYKNPEGETIEWKSGYDLLHEQSTAAAKVRNLLFHTKGVFSTYGNRYNFSQFISFGRNIPMQGRIDFATEFLNSVLPKFTEAEKTLFWDSLLGYPDVDDKAGVSKANLENEAGIIRTPMNLVSFGKNEHPDQKTLLQLAELADDSSGREFLKRYARLATEEYPGLGLDQSIAIDQEIEDGSMSQASPIMFTKDYRDNVNDETKGFLDTFNTIFDTIKKSKTTIEDGDYGLYPRLLSGKKGIITIREASDTRYFIPTQLKTKPNDEVIALVKAEHLLHSMKTLNGRLRISGNIINTAIKDLQESTKLSEQEITSKINLLSEIFFDINFGFNQETGELTYTSDEKVYTDKTLNQMFIDQNIKKEEWAYYKAALELRKIYDYWNVGILDASVKYLSYLKDNLPEGFVNKSLIDKSVRKLEGFLGQSRGMAGRYFPRMFPTDVYDAMAEEWALWNVVSEMFPEEKRAEKYREYRASNQLSEEVQRKLNEEITTLTVDKAEGFYYSWQRTRVIPDWIAAGKYTVDNMKMHSKHMVQFQNMIVNEITRTEWLIYEHNASMRGQSKDIITQMRGWYANMTTDPYMKSEKVKTEELKEGDQVSFWYRQGVKEKRVHGEVLKVSGSTLIMSLNAEAAERLIREQIARYSRTHDEIVTNSLIDPTRDATDRQMAVIEDLREQGYDIPEQDYTLLQANDAIINGLNQVLADRENWGRFDLDRVYVKQYRDNRGIQVSRKVERSLVRGKKEDIWQAAQLFGASTFLSSPGAAVRNFTEAKYRVVQAFGWGRWLHLPEIYSRLLDVLPANLKGKLPFSNNLEIERSRKFATSFLEKAEKGDVADYYKTLYPVVTGKAKIDEYLGGEKLELLKAFVAEYAIKNGLTGATNIGAGYVEEVGASPTKETWNKVKSLPLAGFNYAEVRNRLSSAFLFGYKAIFYNKLTNPQEIRNVIEKGVGLTNSMYDMMYRKAGEGNPSGKVMFQFSQFNTFQEKAYKQNLQQAMDLGQLREVKTIDDLLFNISAFFKTQQVIKNKDGSIITRKIGDTVDPYIPGQMTKYFWQDSIGMVFEMAIPGLRVGNPVNRIAIMSMSMILNAMLTGEGPDDWDVSDWLFTLLGFRLGLGLTFPVQLLYNIVTEKEQVFSLPKVLWAWGFIADMFRTDEVSTSEAWYKAGRLSKFLLSVDITPHTRRYYNEEQNRLTGSTVSKFFRPLIETQSIGGFNIPLPSPDLVPVVGLARYKRK